MSSVHFICGNCGGTVDLVVTNDGKTGRTTKQAATFCKNCIRRAKADLS